MNVGGSSSFPSSYTLLGRNEGHSVLTMANVRSQFVTSSVVTLQDFKEKVNLPLEIMGDG